MKDTEGFSILINGVERTFCDVRDAAYSAARELKGRNRLDLVEVLDRSTGQKVIMVEDGRTG